MLTMMIKIMMIIILIIIKYMIVIKQGAPTVTMAQEADNAVSNLVNPF